jgi:hypothetical protein
MSSPAELTEEDKKKIKEYLTVIMTSKPHKCELQKDDIEALLSSPQAIQDFQIHLMSQWITRNYCCYPVMIMVQCVIQAMLERTEKNPPKEGRFHGWFDLFKKIGDESGAGTVLKTSLSGSASHQRNKEENGVVIKYANTGYEDTVYREYMVGLELNKLREFIPNFMYTFGMYHCNKITEDMDVNESMCDSESKEEIVPYIILQMVKGETLSTLIKKEELSHGEIMIVLLQTFLALDFASKKCQFEHHDLHTSNVMILKTEKPMTIKYPWKNSYITITTNRIPIIIDFGLSSIKINGKYHPSSWENKRHDIRILLEGLIDEVKDNKVFKKLKKSKYKKPEQIVEGILSERIPYYRYDAQKKTVTMFKNERGDMAQGEACSCNDTVEELFSQFINAGNK